MAEKSKIIGSDMTKCDNTTMKIGTRWTIENVSKREDHSLVIGPELYFTTECMYQMLFMKQKKFLTVYLTNKTDTKIAIQRTTAIFDYNNKKLHEENNADVFSLEKDKRVDMIKYESSEKFENLTNDVLIIDLCISIKAVGTKKLNRSICDTDPERKLREDFKTMLENPVNSDVSLQVGNERIAAHWSILCSRSPYFKEMFDSGMKESVQKSVTFTDMSLCTVKKLIQFLYTADFVQEDDIQALFDLYYAADKCEVMDLRSLCGHKIMSNATTDNACAILQLSRRHNDKVLKMEVMDFIHSHSYAVLQTEGWQKFERSEPEIAEIILFCMKKN